MSNFEAAIKADWQGRYVCGTRLAFRNGPQGYRVVCATCHEGGTVRHRTPESANSAATRDSGKLWCKCRR